MSLLAAVAGSLNGIRVSLSGQAISDFVPGAAASASYQLTSAGVVNQITNTGGTSSLGNWITPTSAAGGAYEARVTTTAGTLTSGTTGAWTALSATQTWNVTRSTLGQKTCTFTIEIRFAASGSVLASAPIFLSAEYA